MAHSFHFSAYSSYCLKVCKDIIMKQLVIFLQLSGPDVPVHYDTGDFYVQR